MNFKEFLIYLGLVLFFPGSIRRMEWQMLRMVNRERKYKNKPKVRMQSDLRALARKHSKDMAKRDYFSHKNKKGLKPADRMKVARITDVAAGENLAKVGGFARPIEVAHEGLMKSPGHRKNILEKNYNVLGVGITQSKDGVYYFTQMFATRRIVFTVPVKKRARVRRGLRLKGGLIDGEGQLLYQLKRQGERGVEIEEVLECVDGVFDFNVFAEAAGWYDVLIYHSALGKSKFELMNEFEVKFTHWI